MKKLSLPPELIEKLKAETVAGNKQAAAVLAAVAAPQINGIIGVRNKRRNLYEFYETPFDPSNPGVRGPYPWQVEFHNAGADYSQRMLMAGNRVGKTDCAAAEVAMHATGEYPPWWKGRKFEDGTKIWVGAESNEASRDIVQTALLGPVGDFGTGWIPGARIIGKPKMRQAGVPDVVDTVYVDHISGGISEINFKTYEQGRDKWQGTRKHVVWFDEEPPSAIYSEGLTRTADLGGIVIFTATPLKGVSDVVKMFLEPPEGARMYMKNVTWDDAPHLTEEVKRDLWASYPEHERETRSRGKPLMGAGAIFPIAEERITVDPFPIPDWWARINGVDFGIAHPFAGAFCAHDRESDTFYVYDCFRVKGETPVHHSHAMRKHGDWVPHAWPKDGLQRDKGSGEVLKNQYRKHQLYMLPEHARYNDERGDHTEPGLIEMYEYMRAGKFKVFKTCREWFEEMRFYRRDEKAQVVKEADDLMSATRYAFVMRRSAMTRPSRLAAHQPPAVPMVGGRR